MTKVWICPICQVKHQDEVDWIACDLCDTWFHQECVGLEEIDYDNDWFCKKCEAP